MPHISDSQQPILVIGSTGQLGKSLLAYLSDAKTIAADHHVCDLSQPEMVASYLQSVQPKLIINAGAYTAVDDAEDNEELATLINGISVGVVAEHAFANDIPFVHVSTDYVFDGSGETPWKEGDQVAPIGAYARSKLRGEEAVAEAAEKAKAGGKNPEWLLFRTSWVYDVVGRNFINTMLKMAAEKETLDVVNDQVGAPTYSYDLARFMLVAIRKASEAETFPSGVYHIAGSGQTSWHGFAEAIFDSAREFGVPLKVQDVNAVSSDAFVTKAERPKNSRMDMYKLKDVFEITMPTWQDALARCMEEKITGKKDDYAGEPLHALRA